MKNYQVLQVYKNEIISNKKIDKLLEKEGIKRDANLDYTCAIYDDNQNPIATGSCFGNTLRCLAVDSSYQGYGLLNKIITHLLQYQYEIGNSHFFIYTKINTSKFFIDLGFHEIARVDDELIFLENKKDGFEKYLNSLNCNIEKSNNISAIVMNANPLTIGHQYLIEKAASESNLLHLFIVSEEASLFPFDIRKKLVVDGTKHIKNICYHNSGDYIISSATFPSYFIKDKISAIKNQAELDISVFGRIAKHLNITKRYVGDEPTSKVTNLYNEIMKKRLQKMNIDCIVIPRIKSDNLVISASTVRVAIKNDDYELLKKLLPKSTYDFIISNEASSIVKKIKATDNVIHY